MLVSRLTTALAFVLGAAFAAQVTVYSEANFEGSSATVEIRENASTQAIRASLLGLIAALANLSWVKAMFRLHSTASPLAAFEQLEGSSRDQGRERASLCRRP
ncbi:hypothetical protein VTO42DRAFT_1360 [Malbranchea cinnamomea]